MHARTEPPVRLPVAGRAPSRRDYRHQQVTQDPGRWNDLVRSRPEAAMHPQCTRTDTLPLRPSGSAERSVRADGRCHAIPGGNGALVPGWAS